MKTNLTVLLWVFFSLAGLISCRKEKLVNESYPGKNGHLIERLKTFYEGHSETKGKPISEGDPLWKELFISATGKEYIIPVKFPSNMKAAKEKLSKYLFIRDTGKEMTGTYMYVFDKYDFLQKNGKAGRLFDLFKNAQQGKGDVLIARRELLPADHSGDRKMGSFVGTKIKETKKPLQAKGTSDTVVPANSVPVQSCEEQGGIVIEIQWWYQTYVDGVLVYEEYLYSTYECWGGGGGGGGGGGTVPPTPEQLCQIKSDMFVAAGNAVSEVVSSSVTEGPLEKTIYHNWKFFNAVTWGIYSYEKVRFKRRSIRLGWEFQEYTSLGDAAIGTSIGGTRQYHIISKEAENKVIAAKVSIQFTVTHNVLCEYFPLPPLTLHYTSNTLIGAGPLIVQYES